MCMQAQQQANQQAAFEAATRQRAYEQQGAQENHGDSRETRPPPRGTSRYPQISLILATAKRRLNHYLPRTVNLNADRLDASAPSTTRAPILTSYEAGRHRGCHLPGYDPATRIRIHKHLRGYGHLTVTLQHRYELTQQMRPAMRLPTYKRAHPTYPN